MDSMTPTRIFFFAPSSGAAASADRRSSLRTPVGGSRTPAPSRTSTALLSTSGAVAASSTTGAVGASSTPPFCILVESSTITDIVEGSSLAAQDASERMSFESLGCQC